MTNGNADHWTIASVCSMCVRVCLCVCCGYIMTGLTYEVCVCHSHLKGDVLPFPVRSKQRDHQGLLGEAQLFLAEEMHLHLVVEY